MFSSPFQKLTKASEKNLLFLALTTFLLAGTCMVYFDALLKTAAAPLGIISLELAGNPEKVSAIFTSWKAVSGAMNSAAWSLWFDYVFIVTYVLLLSLLIHKIAKNVWNTTEKLDFRLGIILIRMVFFAGFLDMIENVALLQLFYNGVQKHWTSLAFAAASVKFIILILGILYVLIGSIVYLIKKNTRVKK